MNNELYVNNQYQTKKEIAKASRNVFKAIPSDVILDMATREFGMGSSHTCVCGWAFRLGIEKLKDAGFETLANDLAATRKKDDGEYSFTDEGCRQLYNTASEEEWSTLYDAVTMDEALPIVELEFVKRLDKAVEESL